MYKRMLRSVLATAIAAAALMIGTSGTSDVGWGSAPGKARSVAVEGAEGDVGWGVAPVGKAAVAAQQSDGDVGWGSVGADVTA
jgi:hypothetical protein